MFSACEQIAKGHRGKESLKNKGILTAKTQRAQKKTRDPDFSAAA
jgi:hypothetical protein